MQTNNPGPLEKESIKRASGFHDYGFIPPSSQSIVETVREGKPESLVFPTPLDLAPLEITSFSSVGLDDNVDEVFVNEEIELDEFSTLDAEADRLRNKVRLTELKTFSNFISEIPSMIQTGLDYTAKGLDYFKKLPVVESSLGVVSSAMDLIFIPQSIYSQWQKRSLIGGSIEAFRTPALETQHKNKFIAGLKEFIEFDGSDDKAISDYLKERGISIKDLDLKHMKGDPLKEELLKKLSNEKFNDALWLKYVHHVGEQFRNKRLEELRSGVPLEEVVANFEKVEIRLIPPKAQLIGYMEAKKPALSADERERILTFIDLLDKASNDMIPEESPSLLGEELETFESFIEKRDRVSPFELFETVLSERKDLLSEECLSYIVYRREDLISHLTQDKTFQDDIDHAYIQKMARIFELEAMIERRKKTALSKEDQARQGFETALKGLTDQIENDLAKEKTSYKDFDALLLKIRELGILEPLQEKIEEGSHNDTNLKALQKVLEEGIKRKKETPEGPDAELEFLNEVDNAFETDRTNEENEIALGKAYSGLLSILTSERDLVSLTEKVDHSQNLLTKNDYRHNFELFKEELEDLDLLESIHDQLDKRLADNSLSDEDWERARLLRIALEGRDLDLTEWKEAMGELKRILSTRTPLLKGHARHLDTLSASIRNGLKTMSEVKQKIESRYQLFYFAKSIVTGVIGFFSAMFSIVGTILTLTGVLSIPGAASAAIGIFLGAVSYGSMISGTLYGYFTAPNRFKEEFLKLRGLRKGFRSGIYKFRRYKFNRIKLQKVLNELEITAVSAKVNGSLKPEDLEKLRPNISSKVYELLKKDCQKPEQRKELVDILESLEKRAQEIQKKFKERHENLSYASKNLEEHRVALGVSGAKDFASKVPTANLLFSELDASMENQAKPNLIQAIMQIHEGKSLHQVTGIDEETDSVLYKTTGLNIKSLVERSKDEKKELSDLVESKELSFFGADWEDLSAIIGGIKKRSV